MKVLQQAVFGHGLCVRVSSLQYVVLSYASPVCPIPMDCPSLLPFPIVLHAHSPLLSSTVLLSGTPCCYMFYCSSPPPLSLPLLLCYTPTPLLFVHAIV